MSTNIRQKLINFNSLYMSKFYTEKTCRTPLEKVNNIENIISEQVSKNKNRTLSFKKQKQSSSYKLIVYDPFLTAPQSSVQQKSQSKPKTVYSPQKYGLENMSRRLAQKKKVQIIRAASCSTSPKKNRFIKSSETKRGVFMNKTYIKWLLPDRQTGQIQIKNSQFKQQNKKSQSFQGKQFLQNNQQNRKMPENYFRKQVYPSKKVMIADSNLGEQEEKYFNQYKRMHKLIEEEGKLKLLKLSDKRVMHGKSFIASDLNSFRKQVRTERGHRKKITEQQSAIIKSMRIKKSQKLKKNGDNFMREETDQLEWFTNPQIKKVMKSQKRQEFQRHKNDKNMSNSIQPWQVNQVQDLCQSKKIQ